MGKLLARAYGRVRFSKRKKKGINISRIEYTKPERQIGLNSAIEKHQKELARQKEQKRIARAKQIKKVRGLFGQ